MDNQANFEVSKKEEDNLLTDDPGLWPADYTDQDRMKIVRKLATREKEVEMFCDLEGKPFPHIKSCWCACYGDYYLYTFVRASPERRAIYKENTGCSLHRLSETRWSARNEDVNV
ncbi:hypothetical protein ILYODFUR_032747 [Ilyodon furcidens]|uniref:Uncharacterized protein n=1 Tax=Ilyodon furcidens TaxID=33524 RepID=A0ABV0U0B1_9TELE